MLFLLALLGCTGEAVETEPPKDTNVELGSKLRPPKPPKIVDTDAPLPPKEGPKADRTEPTFLQDGGWLYVYGKDLRGEAGLLEPTEVLFTGRGFKEIKATSVVATEGGLAAQLPPGLVSGDQTVLDVVVNTPQGTTSLPEVATAGGRQPRSGPSGAGLEAGRGWRATYMDLRKKPRVGKLPEMSSPCDLAEVVAPCPVTVGVVGALDIKLKENFDHFLLMLEGTYEAESAGTYTFKLCSVAGSRLGILKDETVQVIVETPWKGQTVNGPCSSGSISLEPGQYTLYVDYFNPARQTQLQGWVSEPGGTTSVLGAGNIWLRPEAIPLVQPEG